jgi:hypothetical protein
MERGAIIGKELADNQPAQIAIYQSLKKLEQTGRDISNSKLKELIRIGRMSAVRSEKRHTLFGEEDIQQSLMVEQAEILDYAKRLLREDRSLFGLVERKKERLSEANNVIDPETNQVISQDAALMLDILDKTAYYQGTQTNTILQETARQLADTGPRVLKKKVLRESYERIKEAVRTDYRNLTSRTGPDPGQHVEEVRLEVGSVGEPEPGSDRGRTANGELDAASLNLFGAEPAQPAKPKELPTDRVSMVKRAMPGISEEQAQILAQDDEMFKRLAQGNIRALERERMLKQLSGKYSGQQATLDGLGIKKTGLFESADTPSSLLSQSQILAAGRVAMRQVIYLHVNTPRAVNRPDLGWVAFYWGELKGSGPSFSGSSGVAKIIAKQDWNLANISGYQGPTGKDLALKLVEVIVRGRIIARYTDPVERVVIGLGDYTADLLAYHEGEDKVWLLTWWGNFGDPSFKASDYFGKTYDQLIHTRPTIGNFAPGEILTESAEVMTPVTVGENISRGLEAMKRVISRHVNEPRAMFRQDLGWIAFYWGISKGAPPNFRGSYGIAKIIAKRDWEGKHIRELLGQRGEDVVLKLVEVIAKGQVRKRYGPPMGERVDIGFMGYTAVLSLHKEKREIVWLLSGWKDITSGGPGEVSDSAGPTHSGPIRTRPTVGAEVDNQNIPTPPAKIKPDDTILERAENPRPWEAAIQNAQSFDDIAMVFGKIFNVSE